MNLGPLYDYLSLLNSKYGIGVVSIALLFLIVAQFFAKPGERSSPFKFLISVTVASVSLCSWAFPFFIFYKSYSGERYEFWPLTVSLFIGFYAFCSTGILIALEKKETRDARIALPLFFVLCMPMSLMVAGAVRLFENFHPLWP